MKEYVWRFEEKTTQPWFTNFQIAVRYYTVLRLTRKIIFLSISVYNY